MNGKTLGHYRVVEQLGRGGMGEVYSAEDLNLNRKVALKFLPDAFAGDPERMAPFEREAKLLASLNHPNIAAIYGLEQAEGKRFIVLELVEGETLAQRLGKGALPVEEALGICRQIAEGLEAAHEKGVIHRDLKPANVMITEGDQVKILDFGLAKALSDEIQSVDSSQSPTLTEAMTRPGVILGTAAYMSPEQAKGKAVDKRADIWAFGCILYECLTGKRAFEGETVTETLAAILKGEPDWNALPPATLSNIRFALHRCLEKDVSRRFHDAADVRIQIEEEPGIDERAAPVTSAWKWLGWALAAVFFVGLAVSAFVYFQRKASSTNELMQFQIMPDVKLVRGGVFAVSPDGRKLAFIGTGSDGVTCVWVRAIDSLEARPIPGTNAVTPFFWSPDSQSLAFWDGTQLKRISISGGPAQSLCDFQGYVIGGAWNRDGVIIFGSNTTGFGLMRVSERGGTASPLTKPDRSRQEIVHKYPSFLRDGRHFLYWRSSNLPENNGVYVGSLDAKPEEQDSKRLLSVMFQPVYIPPQDSDPGHLLFLRQGTLMSQLFDEERLELVGEPVVLAEKVGSYIDSGYFSASTNGVLVYRTSGTVQYSQATWFDRQGKKLGTVGDAGQYRGLSISHDGEHAAVGWMDTAQSSRSFDVWLLDFLRGTNTRLTFGKAMMNAFPVWSPDDRQIIFASDRNGVAANLYRKPASGETEEELLLKSSENNSPTCLSGDGKLLLYTAENPKTKEDLWVLPLEGDREPIPLMRTDCREYDGQFSPDMRWVAYVSDESGSGEIYVQGLSKTSAGISVEGRGKWMISKGGGRGPRWRRDGAELYYRGSEGRIMVVDITAKATFQPGMPKTLFQYPELDLPAHPVQNSLDWSVTSDGNRFLLRAFTETSPTPFTVVLNWTALLKK
jgi:eukaryotic-like serine/threonine-protein kinase